MAATATLNRTGLEGTDQAIETWLADKGVEFSFVRNVSPGNFDAERSLENQARMGAPLKEEVVERYIAALKAGNVFPPVVAFRLPNGKLEILDGNHRRAAHAELGMGLDVYIVAPDTQPAMRSLLTFEANTKHGLPSSVEDRMHHALYMVANGKSVSEASKIFSVPLHTLQKEVTKQNATIRAEENEIPLAKWQTLPAGVQLKLNGISTDDGFAAAVLLAVDARLSTQAVSDLVRQLNKSRSAKTQLGIVKQWREDLKADIQKAAVEGNSKGRSGGAFTTMPGRLSIALGAIKTVWRDSEIPLLTPAQRDEAKARLEAIETQIKEIKAKLQEVA